MMGKGDMSLLVVAGKEAQVRPEFLWWCFLAFLDFHTDTKHISHSFMPISCTFAICETVTAVRLAFFQEELTPFFGRFL